MFERRNYIDLSVILISMKALILRSKRTENELNNVVPTVAIGDASGYDARMSLENRLIQWQVKKN